MAKVKHLTVSLENQPGRLAAVAKALAGAKVNIVAVLGAQRMKKVQHRSSWIILPKPRKL